MKRPEWMIGAAVAAALLAGCEKKPEAKAEPQPSASASTDTQETPVAGRVINEGEPKDGPASLKAPTSVAAGSRFEVDWTGPGNAQDYIDIVPKGFAGTQGEVNYAYVRDAAVNAKLRAPTKPGEYEVRYVFDSRGAGRQVKATMPLTVTEAVVSFTAPPTTAEAGAPMSIAWEGPAEQGDYIDIVPKGHQPASGEITYVYADKGNPSSLKAPGKPAEYEIRYVLEGAGGRVVAARAPLTVTAVSATLKLSTPVAAAKTKFSVEWTGPSRDGDYVDLVPKGYQPTSGEKSYFYTRDGSTGELTAPAAGDYEVRYIMEAPGGRQVLARIPLRAN